MRPYFYVIYKFLWLSLVLSLRIECHKQQNKLGTVMLIKYVSLLNNVPPHTQTRRLQKNREN